MKLMDSHLHLNTRHSLSKAWQDCITDCKRANVRGGFVIHMQHSPWSFEELIRIAKFERNFWFFNNVDPLIQVRHLKEMVGATKDLGGIGIKLHPRIHNFNLNSKPVRNVVEIAARNNLAVNICSFDDGSWGRLGLTPHQFLDLADEFPETKFLWSHAGGFRVIEFMFMARRADNVFLDTSFTQSYFFKGSVLGDLNYATESLSERFIFGSDFENSNYQDEIARLTGYYLSENPDRLRLFSENLLRFVSTDG